MSGRDVNLGSLCHLPPPTILSCDTMRVLRFPLHCARGTKLIHATILDFMMEFYCFLITNLRWAAALQLWRSPWDLGRPYGLATPRLYCTLRPSLPHVILESGHKRGKESLCLQASILQDLFPPRSLLIPRPWLPPTK